MPGLLKIALLTRTKPQALSTFLSHLDHEVFLIHKASDFFVQHTQFKNIPLIFIDEHFLTSPEDYQKMRTVLLRLRGCRVFCLSSQAPIIRIPHLGVVGEEDFNVIKAIVAETQKALDAPQEASVQAPFLEEVIELEEEVPIERSPHSFLALGAVELKGAKSLDEVGLSLVRLMERHGSAKGLVFKYLPNYASVVALEGFNLGGKKANGVGLSFSGSKNFKPLVHLPRLKELPAFQSLLEKFFDKAKVQVRALCFEQEVKLVVVYESLGSMSSAAQELELLCDFAEAQIHHLFYKKLYLANRSKDDLTGCLLKEGLFENLQNEILRAQRVLLPVTLFVVEIDHFEAISARFNSERIQVLVKSFAKLLRDHIRHNDVVGRLADNRFAVVFPHMGLEDAKRKSLSLIKIIQQTRFFSDMKNTLSCTASVGLGVYPTQVSSADELLVGVESLLAHRTGFGGVSHLQVKEGFVKDFEERKLPPSALNRRV